MAFGWLNGRGNPLPEFRYCSIHVILIIFINSKNIKKLSKEKKKNFNIFLWLKKRRFEKSIYLHFFGWSYEDSIFVITSKKIFYPVGERYRFAGLTNRSHFRSQNFAGYTRLYNYTIGMVKWARKSVIGIPICEYTCY